MGRWIALALVAGIAVGACGDDDEKGSTPRGTQATTATQPARPEARLAGGRTVVPGANLGDVNLARLPLGDRRISTAPRRGQLWVCPEFGQEGGGGAQREGAWIHGSTFSLTQKTFVRGNVRWPQARFSARPSGGERVLSGNDLPVGHTTGVFPVAGNDPASAVDPNPNRIQANRYAIELPAQPPAARRASCVGGEVGFAVSGVVINNALDAQRRDAVAHEVQDHCFGHPNPMGYHYHSVSPCLRDSGTGHSALLGYALDGFGIYGYRGEDGTAVTNADLDECHGHVHTVAWDGRPRRMFHYHATWEFPYSVGCFRGRSSVQGPALRPVGGGPPGAPPGAGP
jgi:hypothetical protein